MILKKLILKNFKSHKNTTIEFNKGITIIVGENGVGKSSILEGITYALFKKSTLNQNDLITLDKNNEQKSTMSVTLFFEENGNEYKIVRTNSLSSSNSKLFKGKKLIAQGNSEVNKELNYIINMDMDLFLNAIYIRQGEIADLVSKKPSERKKLIGKFLNIEDLEKTWEKMPKVINTYEKEKDKLNGMFISKSDTSAELSERESDLIELTEDLKTFSNIKEEKEKIVSEILKTKESLDKEKTKYIVLLNSITNEKFNLQKMKNNKLNLVKEYNTIVENEKEYQEIEKKIKNINYDEYNDIIIDLKSENKSFDNTNLSLEESLDEISEIENKCPICQSEISDEKKKDLIDYYQKTIDENNIKIEINEKKIKDYNQKINEWKKYNGRYIELKTLIKDKYNVKKKIKDLEKLLDNDSIYSIITTSDIKAIISKYNGLEEYLSSVYKLDYYNDKEGFAIELSTLEVNEFDVKELQSKIKKRFVREFIIETVGIYDTLNQVVLYCEFCD